MALPEVDALLTRERNADALTEAGFPTSPKTLATKASRGGGPPFRKFGQRALYRWGDSLEWARSQLGPLMHSTSEADAVPVRTAEQTIRLTQAQPRSVVITTLQQHTAALGDESLGRTPTSQSPLCPRAPGRPRSRSAKTALA